MFNENSYNKKMSKTIEVFSKELSSLRTGRANASMLDLIKMTFTDKNAHKSTSNYYYARS